jgi:hypothetical protein
MPPLFAATVPASPIVGLARQQGVVGLAAIVTVLRTQQFARGICCHRSTIQRRRTDKALRQ